MAFPTNPVNLQEYTNALGTTYQYIAADTKWIIKTQEVGVTGAQGSDGAQGVTGLIGETGTIGATGSQGITGLIGSTGLIGATGLIGSTGLIGATGLIGSTGLIGATGLQGITGLQGTTGILGINGTTGAQGVTGLSGLGTTGAQGVTGTNAPVDPINFSVYDNGNSGSALQIQLFRGQKQKVSISTNTTLYMGATGISGAGTYTLKATFAGAYTLGWTGVYWPGGTIPYHSNANGAVDLINIYYDGTAFYGVGAIGLAYP